MKNKEVAKELKALLKNKKWLTAIRDYTVDEIEYSGEVVEPYEVPLKIIAKLKDPRLEGYLQHEWEEWASESGDYEGGVDALWRKLK